MSGLDPSDLDRPDWNSLKKNYSKHDIGSAYFRGRVEQMGLHVEDWGIDMRNHDDSLIFDNKMDMRLWEPVDGQTSCPNQWPSDNHMYDEAIKPTYVTQDYGSKIPPAFNDDRGLDMPDPVEELTWELRALVDVKTKANEQWMGKMNLRHLVHYSEWAEQAMKYGIPTAVYFTMVDTDEERVGDRNVIVPVDYQWPWDELLDESLMYPSMSMPRIREIAMKCEPVKGVFNAPDGNVVVEFDDEYYENFNWVVENVL